jgi:hypothetical protein
LHSDGLKGCGARIVADDCDDIVGIDLSTRDWQFHPKHLVEFNLFGEERSGSGTAERPHDRGDVSRLLEQRLVEVDGRIPYIRATSLRLGRVADRA